MSSVLEILQTWFETSIATSSLWAGAGLAAVLLLGLYVVWKCLRGIGLIFRALTNMLAARRRKSQQGYGISIVPFTGPKGRQQTKVLKAALEKHLSQFAFGAPYEVLLAPRLRAKGAKGLRAAATEWLERSATDVVVWGHRQRGRQTPTLVEVLSCEGSLSPQEASHSVGTLPLQTKQNRDTVAVVNAYLVARNLLPGLANATAFKAEKIAPVADTLLRCLNVPDALPERTQLTLEMDYCAMALHIGSLDHLERVVTLRRARLQAATDQDTALTAEVDIQSRVDLGRALLKISAEKFDPLKVREAVDQLKIAIEHLKTNPVLQLAGQTSAAVQQGQALLANRKRFSVTGGANL